jgi:hypothetical protein
MSICAVVGILGVAVLLGAGPATAGMKIHARHNPTVDFTEFRTYAWDKGTSAAHEQIQASIVVAIERELDACGLVKTDEAPDLLVVSDAFGAGSADVRAYGAWFGTFAVVKMGVETVTDGTLWVNLIDPDSNEPVWAGAANGAFTGDIKKVPRRIDKIVRKMFKDFPTK